MSIAPLTPLTNTAQLMPIIDAPQPSPGSGAAAFSQVLEGILAASSQTAQKANQQVQSLLSGQAENLHSVSIAVAQADVSFRFLLELRNRATDAYQEIMRMQI